MKGRASLDSLLKNVLKKVTPSREEEREINSAIETVSKAVEKSIGKLSYTLAGSFTRNTWMKDKKEFDVFILFPEYTKRSTLEKKGLEMGRKITSSLKGTSRVAYAEHPYTRAKFKGFAIDIVPCYKVSSASSIKSAVDRTPFHNEYLARNFMPGLAKEVRLLKQFLKASGLYGSDARTLGFSGYLCELLILHYKSFKVLLKEASKWEPGEFIDLERHHSLKPKFLNQPLMVIDPVDPRRNVSAVVSPENFMKFVSASRALLKQPKESSFFRKPPKARPLGKKLKSRKTLFLGIEFSSPDVIDDILYPQLRRTANRLAGILKDYEFVPMGWDVFSDEKKCLILLEMEVWELPNIRKIRGPPVSVKKRSKEFLGKYRSGRIQVEGKEWVAEISRKFPLAEDLLKKTLRQTEKKLLGAGIASHVSKSVSKGFRLLKEKELLKKAKSPEFYSFLQAHMEEGIEEPL